MLREFRNFIARGNVMDLAVAVILGGAFSAIVSSLVKDIITPGLLNPVMKAAQVEKLEGLVWNGVRYGSFLAAVINFLIIAFVIFLLVRIVSNVQKQFDDEPEPEKKDPAPSTEARLLTQIRDLLKQQTEVGKPADDQA
ncbi:large conductance mechanosensitive channel protein MscL [Rubinisphaera brasiliensis]|uniref:Large-conductance mechanosensitive channel n=1 Tax=Rubinisphaera brasiliensis (strain ATCC 49424 / DSM 5305 / JCM 21570 / IAM 15109 / NBRC 103401 / IFAM 1448) TaxID=756272 RepID=F0SJZ4_RUBBR|nr:large conductance mechanosensitive channel protein MscL [Rubinisphaera brasiliensis]ADY58683.1 Large-conductance mechanosensitive channel [Rubinisphaera brasiliensis DSM 5305]